MGGCFRFDACRYLWDHRNQSLRNWLVDEFVGGANGLGNPSVDGFFFDDGWSTKVRDSGKLIKGGAGGLAVAAAAFLPLTYTKSIPS